MVSAIRYLKQEAAKAETSPEVVKLLGAASIALQDDMRKLWRDKSDNYL